MLVRPVALLFLLLLGCSPTREAQMDEQRNPYFIEGKQRISTRDYKGAIAAFEKALEINPRSPLAHFELGVLYEQHSELREDDFVAALYHYNQAVRLRPDAYPADNARQRIASCKQELVRSQSMAPVYQQTIRELDRLKDENQHLRRQLEALNVQVASRFVAPAGIGAASSDGGAQAASHERSRPGTTIVSQLRYSPGNAFGKDGTGLDTPIIIATNPAPQMRDRTAPAGTTRSTGRSHTVRAGDTAYSIARSYRVRLDALLAANPRLDPKHMKIGQTLSIPASP